MASLLFHRSPSGRAHLRDHPPQRHATEAEFVEAIAKSLHTAAGLDNQSTTSVADSNKLIRKLTRGFKDRFSHRLHKGSSQGACMRCAAYMDDLDIGYGSTQAMNRRREETWLHPVAMTTAATGYRYHNRGEVRLDATGRTLRALKDE